VASVSDFERAVKEAGGRQIVLLVNRGGARLYAVIEGR
jgi:hypothetical protein